jgi:fatty acid amide hydrolase
MTLQEAQHAETIIDLSASELAERMRAGDISAHDVVEAHIQRIEAVNPQLNAVVIPLFEEARAQAMDADRARSRGDELGPLHGVPVTIKEQFRVKGTQTTLGATNKIGNVYHSEGPLVSKLREAGAIILGKTNIIQTLAGWESDNRVYGRANNPWNLDRSSGGSSGGEAAIIAARGSALGLAGDYGGSTRIPAHFCGVHGLKPTSGRLSNDDFPSDLLGSGQEVFIPQPGPIARTVADLQLAMALFAETSMKTTGDLVPPVPWPDPKSVQLEGMRIGMYTDNGYFQAAPALRRAVKEAADALRKRGAIVEPFTPPDVAEAMRIFLGSVSAGGGKDYKRLLGDEKPIPQIAGLFQGTWSPPFALPIVAAITAARGQDHLARTIRNMGARSTEKYWDLVEARNRYRARFHQTLDEGLFEAILCPPFATPALTHGASEHLFPAASYALVYNVLGAPAGVVSLTKVRPGEESDREVSKDMADITARNVERGSVGLPVAVQVVARHWREDIVLSLMAALEDHFRATPDYPARPD